tara:strand:- start:239 stop:595 length:357 start_codon:yes stop_codon:yes gene_type:complete
MNYTVKGTITTITEVEVLPTGAAKLSYRIDTGEAYNSLWEFEIYKGADHVEHAHNFVKYNKVGDVVEVEFNIRPRVWEEKDRVFTTLSHWKCTKLEESNAATSDAPATEASEDDDLPF